MPNFVRVAQVLDGKRREFSIARSSFDADPADYELLDKPGTAADGTVLPPKFTPDGLASAPAPDDEGYAGRTKAELQAEIEARNATRDEPLATSGTKDELVARLTEDDKPALPEAPPESLSNDGQTATNQKEQAR